MNKNNIIGFLLIAVVLIGFSWYNQPSAEEQRAAFVQDSIAKAKHAEMEKASKAAAAKRQTNAKAKVEADSTALFYYFSNWNAWGIGHAMPEFAKKSFHQLWKEGKVK